MDKDTNTTTPTLRGMTEDDLLAGLYRDMLDHLTEACLQLVEHVDVLHTRLRLGGEPIDSDVTDDLDTVTSVLASVVRCREELEGREEREATNRELFARMVEADADVTEALHRGLDGVRS